MLRPEFTRGIATLAAYDLTYDILIYPKHLAIAEQLVGAFPNQPFVIDHMAIPDIGTPINSTDWSNKIENIALNDDVYCKLSGIITEADWNNWTYEDIVPFLDMVMNVFGVDRVMVGSDWPVCLLAGSYSDVHDIIWNYIQQFTVDEKTAIMGGNAITFYNLS